MNEAQKAEIRAWKYKASALATVGGPLLGAALAEGAGLSQWVSFGIAAVGILTGATQLGMAGRRTNKQVAGGVFDDPPAEEPAVAEVGEVGPPPSPDQVFAHSLEELVGNANVHNAALQSATQIAAQTLGLGMATVSDVATEVAHGAIDTAARAANAAIARVARG